MGANKIDILVSAVADAAERELKKVRTQIEGIGQEAQETKAKNADFNAGLAQIGTQAASVAGVLIAFGAAVKQGYEWAREGAELDTAEEKFERLAESIGTTSDALMGDLRTSTRGLVSDAELVAGATDLMSLGLVKNHEQAVRLSRSVGALDMEMNALTLTLTNKTTARFDTLGVAVDGFDEKVQALIESGMDADEAFSEAFLQQAEEQIEKVGEAADSSIANFKRLEASFENLTDAAKRDLTPAFAGLSGVTADYFDAVGRVNDSMPKFARYLGPVYSLLVGFEMAAGDATYQTVRLSDAQIEAAASTESFDRSLRNYNYTATESAPVTADLNREIGELLSMTAEVGREMERYNQKQDDTIAKREEVKAQIEALIAEGYSPESEQVLELQTRLGEYSAALQENAIEYENATNVRILKRTEEILAADGLTQAEEEALLQMGLNMGVYTAEYVAQAQTVIDKSNELAAIISGLPTQKTFSYYMNVAGSIPENINLHLAGERAEGGDVSKGEPYLVGERGAEIFVPESNGYIVPNHMLGASSSTSNFGGNNVVINVNGAGDADAVANKIMRKLRQQGVMQ